MRSIHCTALALVVCAFAAFPAAASLVSVGQSGWAWSSPQPQGNTLRAIEFTGGVGYAAGDFGTVLKTQDGGSSWQGLPTGMTAELRKLRLVGQNTVVVAGGCLVRRSDDGGQTFVRIPWTPSEASCSSQVGAIDFPSASVGYIVLQNGTLMRTSDGGKSWARKTSVPKTQTAPGAGSAVVTDVRFLSPDLGFATLSSNSGMYRSTDGGASWSPVIPVGTLNSLQFATTQSGFAAGDGGLLLRTDDGGTTWSAIDTISELASGRRLTSVKVAGDLMMVTEEQGGALLRSADNGATWAAVSPASRPIHDAAIASSTRVVGVGAAGTTVLSDDAGANWRQIGMDVPSGFARIRASAAGAAIATGPNGAMLRTVDGGQSWTGIGAPTAESVVDAAFPSANVGYALDNAGAVLRTDNAGASWSLLDHGASFRLHALVAPAPERVVLVGSNGVRLSRDGGQTFANGSGKGLNGASLLNVDAAGSALVAHGPKQMFVSADGGRTWKATPRSAVSPKGGKTLDSVDFATAKLGYVLTSDNRVFITRNGGKAWLEALGIGLTEGAQIAVGDASRAWVSDNINPRVMYTSDGGKTWRPQRLPADNATAMAAFGTGGFMATRQGKLFTTATGGDAGKAVSLSIKTAKRTMSKAALKRARSKMKVTGRLSPASAGDYVRLQMRTGGNWEEQLVQVSGSGTFTTTWDVRRDAAWVAHFEGDSTRRGAGSKILEFFVR